MRWYLTLLLLTILTTAQAQSLDYDVKNIDNQWINLEELSGEEYTVIDFWATWCKPCVSALPKINQLSKDFESKGVKFIGVNVDGPRNQAKVKPFSQSLNLSYAIVLDPDQEILSELNASVLPTLIIVDKNFKEVFRHEGFSSGDEKMIKDKLVSLLK
ncbi:MAG: TlpA disulfide reductase family protein [Prolixibacteraceae bacterium]|jgi:cytochrome c biogenesis protein CcmG/thiol:disulfide interchange protein DsbE|nr:TlpA disulfide reductase family protein [Prolixibacteraceae bacterium]